MTWESARQVKQLWWFFMPHHRSMFPFRHSFFQVLWVPGRVPGRNHHGGGAGKCRSTSVIDNSYNAPTIPFLSFKNPGVHVQHDPVRVRLLDRPQRPGQPGDVGVAVLLPAARVHILGCGAAQDGRAVPLRLPGEETPKAA